MEFSRQEYWSGLPFPSPGNLPNQGIEPRSPALQACSLPSEPLQFSSVAQLCPTLCDLMDCNLPGLSVHGVLQARILEWIAFPSPGNLPNQGIEPRSSGLQACSLPSEPLQFSSVAQLCLTLCRHCLTLAQHPRPPCPSPTPRIYSNL